MKNILLHVGAAVLGISWMSDHRRESFTSILQMQEPNSPFKPTSLRGAAQFRRWTPEPAMRLLTTISFALLAGCTSRAETPMDHWHQLEAESSQLTSAFRGALREQEMLPVHNQF